MYVKDSSKPAEPSQGNAAADEPTTEPTTGKSSKPRSEKAVERVPVETSSKSEFDISALAQKVIVAEATLKSEYLARMWAIADMLAEGLTQSGLSVTRYTSEMTTALRKSDSYVDKYLRLAKVLPEQRKQAAEQCETFTAAWGFLFPPRAKAPQRTPPTTEASKPIEPAAETANESPAGPVAGRAPDARPDRAEHVDADEADPDDADDADAVDSDPVDADSEDDEEEIVAASNKPARATGDLSPLLQALEVPDLMSALTRLTQLRQQEQAARSESETLRLEVQKLKRERDAFLSGGLMGDLFRELGVKTLKEAVATVKEIKRHAP